MNIQQSEISSSTHEIVKKEKTFTGGFKELRIVPVPEPPTANERTKLVALDNDRNIVEAQLRAQSLELDHIKETRNTLINWAEKNNRQSASQTIKDRNGDEIKISVSLGEKNTIFDSIRKKLFSNGCNK